MNLIQIVLVAVAAGITLHHGLTGRGALWVAVLLLCLAMVVPAR